MHEHRGTVVRPAVVATTCVSLREVLLTDGETGGAPTTRQTARVALAMNQPDQSARSCPPPDAEAPAKANNIPVVDLRSTERNIEVMLPYLEAAARSGRSQVAAVGTTQEYQRVWTATKHHCGPDNVPRFSLTRQDRPVKCFYIYDDQFGPGFIKICSYFPYQIKVWPNGHE